MNPAVWRCASIFFWCAAGVFAQTTGEDTPPRAAAPPADVDAAKLELQLGAVDLALFNAEVRLGDGAWDEAIAMAWAGLEQAEVLPASPKRSSRMETLMQVIVDARVEKRLADFLANKPVEPPAEPAEKSAPAGGVSTKTGLSDEAPPPRPTPLAEALSNMGEPADLPERVVVYPEDWSDRSNRTPPERTGILFEGKPFEDAQGNTMQTIVYDVRSLILPTPNFQYVPLRDLHGATQSAADRNALHTGSEIFNGRADDLAAGAALLGDFGGAGNWPADFTDDGREMAELIRVIEEMTTP